MYNLQVVNDALDTATGGAYANTRTNCANETQARDAIKNRGMTLTRGGVSHWGTIGLNALEAWDNRGDFAETFFWFD